MFGYATIAENIQRILSELKPEPTFWCSIGWHVWGRWEVKDEGRYASRTRFEELRRECKHCGLSQLREIKEKRRV